MTALRPERESGAGYGQSFTDGSPYGAGGGQGTPYGQQPYGEPGAFGDGGWYDTTQQGAYSYGGAAGGGVGGGGAAGVDGGTAYLPPVDEETVALRIPDPPERTGYDAGTGYDEDTGSATYGSRGESSAASADSGGRAARRKAAKKRQGRRGGANRPAEDLDAPHGHDAPQEPRAPLSRVEARRRARERKPSAAVVASRGIGEVFITCGVLMLLFVTYQLWWTNVRAQAQAGREASDLQSDWASGKRSPGAFEPGKGFALLHIPRLDVVVPIAEGIDSKKVLDRGMVGHYAEGALKTAMPEAKEGNFGVAGHRNTHGEPFRYINRLEPGDPIVVETQDTYFVYKMASILPVTSPSNISVLEPVPKQSGFKEPGRYITLTTCTPEFTSTYRMIVWGKMDEERPRSKGKPDALVS
ncbi:class E sortase [Streptomyces sp. GDS52]|uniref:Class E sortase n=1 Tax=Streptomyces cathayae TaxID=3031124 RepID=A0ABY8K0X4_9ACTN|nr:class E sortase [Streptomyces sp. HUAS 5]WGD41899.1 class E sortase [Streptomyces sp. HUAS 5]